MKNLKNLCYKLALICGLILTSFAIQAQVLELDSTTEGVLLPRMTTAQRTTIASPSQSETVYDTDTKSFWYWENMMWNELGASSGITGTPFLNCGVGTSGDTLRNTLPAVRDTITLTSTEVITAETHVSICLDLDHTFVADLDINLISPNLGVTIDLTSDNGDTGENFKGTCFTSTAKSSITSVLPSDAPFSDVYLPEGSLSTLVGQSINGDWTLEITDDASGDEGILNTWEINFTNSFAIVSQKSFKSDFATNATNATNAETSKALEDTDGDTKVQVEENNDEDMIRFDIGGTPELTLKKAPNNHLIFDLENSNVLIGAEVGDSLTTGYQNVNIGFKAGLKTKSGNRNVILGPLAGENTTTGQRNTYLGEQAGQNNSSGSNNVMVGVGAGDNSMGSNNVFIGSFAGSNETTNQKLYIEGGATATSSPLIYGEFDTNKLLFFGNVGIGNTTDNQDLASGYKLSVKGKVICEEVRVELEANWPDYVFEKDYNLKSLEEVENYIEKEGHLPNVPSAVEIESEGLQLGEMNKILMEKVEELTLYIIAQEKRIKALEATDKN